MITGVAALSILTGCSLLLQAYLTVRTLPAIADPVRFAEELEPTRQEPVNLGVGGIEGRVIRSPFFPGRKLTTTSIVAAKCLFQYSEGKEANLSLEGRYLNVDPFWKIFWVEVARCGERTQFFGPYRLQSDAGRM